MAFKEGSRVEVIEIIRRWQVNTSLRGLARATGLSRKTVKKYLQAAEKCGVTRNGPTPCETQLLTLAPLNVPGPQQGVRPSEELLGPWALRGQLKDVVELLTGSWSRKSSLSPFPLPPVRN